MTGVNGFTGGDVRLHENGAGQEPNGLLPEIFSDERWRELGEHLGLTPRQRQIARMICRGTTKETIARELSISVPTVRMHADALYKRLRVHSRLALAIRLVLAERKLARRTGRASET